MKNKIFLKGLITKSAEGKYHVIASTAALDRQGESIEQSGWDVANFNTNPIILYSHDYSEATLPIGRGENVMVSQAGLEMDIVFASPEASPLAQQIKALVDEGILNTLSVGFMVKNRNGNIITQAELLEVSIVKVPANPGAVIAMRSMTDIDDEVKKDIEAAADEKGAVQAEITAQEQWEKKWCYLDEVMEIMGAFYTVYLAEETDPEKIGELLTEAAGLLLEYAKNPTTETDEDADTEAEKTFNANAAADKRKAFIELTLKRLIEIDAKAGAEISAKNKKKLASALDNAKNVVAVLDDLMASVSDEDSGKNIPAGEVKEAENESAADEDGQVEAPKVEEPEPVKSLSLAALKGMRNRLVINDKQNEKLLVIVNDAITAHFDDRN